MAVLTGGTERNRGLRSARSHWAQGPGLSDTTFQLALWSTYTILPAEKGEPNCCFKHCLCFDSFFNEVKREVLDLMSHCGVLPF